MAFITLRRSRNTRSYYLVESYRDDQGRPRQRTLCYLGREADGTDTLEKALAHWQRARRRTARALRAATGDRSRVLAQELAALSGRIALLKNHMKRATAAQASTREREERAALAIHWQAIDRLRRAPSTETARAAKRAFRVLTLRLHPDQGGDAAEFIRLKAAYDRAEAVWRRKAGRADPRRGNGPPEDHPRQDVTHRIA